MNIIPKPMKYEERSGKKVLTTDSLLFVCEELSQTVQRLFDTFELTKSLRRTDEPESADLSLKYNGSLGKEAYRISIDETRAVIEASDNGGALYAVETLRQLVFFDGNDSQTLSFPCVYIDDAPRYRHRGLMLDESRHFFGKEYCKKLFELMAFYKLNTFHWHLTDDQGWRIEIKKYPLLTEIGSKRKDTQLGGWHTCRLEGKPHGGFYTQEDIKELVEYAARLNITVIPEIDMPAHFAAAIAAYNHLACREIKSEVHWFFGDHIPKSKGWYDSNRPSCAGKETTYEFIFGVLDEITELFPSPFFHIGGDEAPKNEWKKCPECQKRMRENGLRNEEELQGYFNNRISQYLKEKGKRLIVWNEALKAENLDRSVVGQYWTARNDANVLRHIEKGGDVVISKHQAFYFDMCYSHYPLKNTYFFEATEKMIPEKYEDRILGLEGELWTEWIADTQKADLQLFPRTLALSECCWTKDKNKDFAEFLERKKYHERILDGMGVNYAVDEVSMPRGLIKRSWKKHLWFKKDPYIDVKLNRELKK